MRSPAIRIRSNRNRRRAKRPRVREKRKPGAVGARGFPNPAFPAEPSFTAELRGGGLQCQYQIRLKGGVGRLPRFRGRPVGEASRAQGARRDSVAGIEAPGSRRFACASHLATFFRPRGRKEAGPRAPRRPSGPSLEGPHTPPLDHRLAGLRGDFSIALVARTRRWMRPVRRGGLGPFYLVRIFACPDPFVPVGSVPRSSVAVPVPVSDEPLARNPR